MTRGFRALLLVGLFAPFLWGASAQAESKIGTVDLDLALNSTDEGKAAREEFARKKREADEEMKPLLKRFDELRKEIEGKKYVLSDEALFARQADLLELKNKIDNKIKELEGQLKIDQGRLEAPLRTKLAAIIEEVGKEKGFSLILSRNTPGVMYSREALDVTDLVIKRFNSSKK